MIANSTVITDDGESVSRTLKLPRSWQLARQGYGNFINVLLLSIAPPPVRHQTNVTVPAPFGWTSPIAVAAP